MILNSHPCFCWFKKKKKKKEVLGKWNDFWNVSATSRISWDRLWHTGTISLREEIGFPTADGFPGLAYPTPTVLKLLNAQLVFPKVSKRIEPTPEILHCSSCIISQALRKGPAVSLCAANKFSPSQPCATLLFFTWFKGTCKNKQERQVIASRIRETPQLTSL